MRMNKCQIICHAGPYVLMNLLPSIHHKFSIHINYLDDVGNTSFALCSTSFWKFSKYNEHFRIDMLIRPEVGNMFKHSLGFLPSQLCDYRIANEILSTKQHDEMWTPYQTNVFDQPQIHQSIWSNSVITKSLWGHILDMMYAKSIVL